MTVQRRSHLRSDYPLQSHVWLSNSEVKGCLIPVEVILYSRPFLYELDNVEAIWRILVILDLESFMCH